MLSISARVLQSCDPSQICRAFPICTRAGLLFVRFSKSRPKIFFADQAVVTSHNCSPTLMVRIANGRMTLLTNATVQLGVLLFEESAEGHSLRRLHDLVLSNTSLSLFALTWTGDVTLAIPTY